MADIIIGGISLQESSTSQPKVDTFGMLATNSAGIIDSGQPTIVATAKEGILRGIDDINMRKLFDFGRKQQTDTALVAAQQAYSLPTAFFAVSDVQLIDTTPTPDEIVDELEYVPWRELNVMESNQTAQGLPKWWTVLNSFDDEEFLVYPIPTSNDTSYSLRLTYFGRIERPSQDSDIIVAPRELSHVLELYGEYHVLQRHDAGNDRFIERKLAEYRDALKAFSWSRKRQPDRQAQFRIPIANRSYSRVGRRPIAVTYKS